MKQMALKTQRQSLKNKIFDREPLQQQKRIKNIVPLIGQRGVSKELILRFDINTLLSLFNEMDIAGFGAVSKKGIIRILQTIGMYNQENHFKQQSYTFDHFLSIMGQIQVPEQPSIYVLSFVKILAGYRDKSLQNDELGLQEAQQVQEKIKQISKNQLQRQKIRIKVEHNRIYQQMQVSQQQQLQSFETEWQNYLKQFKEQTSRRLQQTKSLKKQKVIEQSNKFFSKVKRSSVITSPRLIQLKQKRKWLIKQKRYDNAIQIDNEIDSEKRKLSGYQVQVNDQVFNKKMQKLNKTTNRYLGALQKNLQVNFKKLMSKKKQGENIMKIRMKNLRQQANRKLNQHYRSEMNRLRSSLYVIANN